MSDRQSKADIRAEMEDRMERVIRIYDVQLAGQRRVAEAKHQQEIHIARAAAAGQPIMIMGVRYIPDPERDTSA